ncbi:MAG: fumarylacetoacetate hydrolase family protein [Fimbriimonadaceae bacterium]|nr:fumarylacetoacetate hydrolase family protein [Fimbriimonadaceae bacterium]
MKLCRFELLENPGTARSGFYYGGKVYETDGQEAIAVHESSIVRFLSPIGTPPSVRLFHYIGAGFSEWAGAMSASADTADLGFAYLNAASVVGPNLIIKHPYPDDIGVVPCLAIVVANPAESVDPDISDGLLLGLMPAMVFYYSSLAESDRMRGLGPARSHDIACVIGPALTTPEELEDCMQETPHGQHYELEFALKVNKEDVAAFTTDKDTWTPADLIAYASRTRPVLQGDILLIALGTAELKQGLASEDEVILVSDRLGALGCVIE